MRSTTAANSTVSNSNTAAESSAVPSGPANDDLYDF